jgi:hypothetical protein
MPDYMLLCNKLVNQQNKEEGTIRKTTCKGKIYAWGISDTRE